MTPHEPPALDLRDPRQAGVYRVMQADVASLVRIATEESVAVHEIDLEGADDKDAMLARVHRALDFPADWGRNWDAFEDGLRDLSWLGDETPRLLIWRGMDDLHADAPEVEETLCAILDDGSAYWADEGIALWSLVVIADLPV